LRTVLHLLLSWSDLWNSNKNRPFLNSIPMCLCFYYFLFLSLLKIFMNLYDLCNTIDIRQECGLNLFRSYEFCYDLNPMDCINSVLNLIRFHLLTEQIQRVCVAHLLIAILSYFSFFYWSPSGPLEMFLSLFYFTWILSD